MQRGVVSSHGNYVDAVRVRVASMAEIHAAEHSDQIYNFTPYDTPKKLFVDVLNEIASGRCNDPSAFATEALKILATVK